MKQLRVGIDNGEIEALTGETMNDGLWKKGEIFIINESSGNWIVKRIEGDYYAIVGMGDGLFSTEKEAFEFVRKNL